MLVCCTKWSSVVNSIYPGQELFSYNRFIKYTINLTLNITSILIIVIIKIGSVVYLIYRGKLVQNINLRKFRYCSKLPLYFYTICPGSISLFLKVYSKWKCLIMIDNDLLQGNHKLELCGGAVTIDPTVIVQTAIWLPINKGG